MARELKNDEWEEMAQPLLDPQHPQLVVIKQTYLTYFLMCI